MNTNADIFPRLAVAIEIADLRQLPVDHDDAELAIHHLVQGLLALQRLQQ